MEPIQNAAVSSKLFIGKLTDQELREAVKDSGFNKLPSDVIRLIFEKLGVSDLRSLTLVCKKFNREVINSEQMVLAVARQLNIPIQKGTDTNEVGVILKLNKMVKFENMIEIQDNVNPPKILLKIPIDASLILTELGNVKEFVDNNLLQFPHNPYLQYVKNRIDESISYLTMFKGFTDMTFILTRLAFLNMPSNSWVERGSLIEDFWQGANFESFQKGESAPEDVKVSYRKFEVTNKIE